MPSILLYSDCALMAIVFLFKVFNKTSTGLKLAYIRPYIRFNRVGRRWERL